MASTQTISEGNGATAATETASRTESNWKRIDDSTTAYSSSPINSSNNENSMTKYQAIKFGGTFNTLSALTIKIDNNAPATGLAIVGAVVSAGVTPATTASGDAAMSTTGAAANFLAGAALTYGAGTTTLTTSTVGYSQAVRTQLQTTSSYAGGPGDIVSRTFTWTWTES
jgi:hypothetical protein